MGNCPDLCKHKKKTYDNSDLDMVSNFNDISERSNMSKTKHTTYDTLIPSASLHKKCTFEYPSKDISNLQNESKKITTKFNIDNLDDFLVTKNIMIQSDKVEIIQQFFNRTNDKKNTYKYNFDKGKDVVQTLYTEDSNNVAERKLLLKKRILHISRINPLFISI
jgi:hypothetical protein